MEQTLQLAARLGHGAEPRGHVLVPDCRGRLGGREVRRRLVGLQRVLPQLDEAAAAARGRAQPGAACAAACAAAHAQAGASDGREDRVHQHLIAVIITVGVKGPFILILYIIYIE